MANQSLKLFKVQKLINQGGVKGYPFLSTNVILDKGVLTIDGSAYTGDVAIAEFDFQADTPVAGVTVSSNIANNCSRVIWTASKLSPSEIEAILPTDFTNQTEDAENYNLKLSSSGDNTYTPLTLKSFLLNKDSCKSITTTDLFKCTAASPSQTFSNGKFDSKTCTYANSGATSITFALNKCYAFLNLTTHSSYFDTGEVFLYVWVLIDVLDQDNSSQIPMVN